MPRSRASCSMSPLTLKKFDDSPFITAERVWISSGKFFGFLW